MSPCTQVFEERRDYPQACLNMMPHPVALQTAKYFAEVFMTMERYQFFVIASKLGMCLKCEAERLAVLLLLTCCVSGYS